MFLSVIVPVYNCEKYLAECLRSFIEQDLPDKDYEVICVNDGSTDESAVMLSEWSDTHPVLRILTQENAGVSAARNNGLAIARGDYVWFVDSDDFIAWRILGELRKRVTEAGCPDLVQLSAYSFQSALTAEETSNFESIYSVAPKEKRRIVQNREKWRNIQGRSDKGCGKLSAI